jgi:glycosyltransferase involved in cell wall biosynthesis
VPKVLRIINRFNLGGPTFNAAILTRYLAPKYETLLIGGKEEASEKSSSFILDQFGVEGKIVEEMQRKVGFLNDRDAYKTVKGIIKDFKPDIIHTHASKAGALGRSAGIAYGKAKLVHTFHGHVFHSYFGRIKTGIYKNIERALALKTDKIIAISERQKLELVKKYRITTADKVEVIPLGFELEKFSTDQDAKREQFRKNFNLDEDEIAVGVIGRLAPVKNHKLFLDALQVAKNGTTKKIRAFIIGDGEERENLKEYATLLGLAYLNGDFSGKEKPDVQFTSWIKEIDIATAGLDIIALTSHNEGTPVSLIEAQAAGKPIISTKVGGVIDTVIPNQTALLVKANDSRRYSKALLKLIENENYRQKLSQQGIAYANEKYHFSRLVSDMDKLYTSLLE